ncbi:hypothetical protein [Shewanella glacialimarina]|uniref:hypothetical protein n=1 Tax=Shewanella glacialimarina TaxID=2590884 RepID=UPI001CF80C0A|nr:hypothetical protein [Shewanella glacialimarina]UCX05373.1 hypothetical protein FJ709_13260 [Shewanella glacialimarina]
MKKLSLLTIAIIQVASLIFNTSQADEICAFGYCTADEVSKECKIDISEIINNTTSHHNALIRIILIQQLEELEQLRATIIDNEYSNSLAAIDHFIYQILQNTFLRQQKINGWPNTTEQERAIKLMQASINNTPLNISPQQSLESAEILSELLNHR